MCRFWCKSLSCLFPVCDETLFWKLNGDLSFVVVVGGHTVRLCLLRGFKEINQYILSDIVIFRDPHPVFVQPIHLHLEKKKNWN